MSLLLGLALACGPGCSVPEGPELAQVASVSPSLVEAGGALIVAGRGFPAGRGGQLQLEGTSLVPGRDPEPVTLEWSGQATSSARVVAPLTEEQTARLTGGARHATFRGRFSISFEPVRSGAPALRGQLKDVTLDVLLSSGAAPVATDFAQHIGLALGADLSVVAAPEGQEAHAAGLRVGDRLHRLDGVRLLTVADFAPRAHGRTSLLEFSRPGHAGHAEVLLDRSDYFRSDEASIWLAASVGIAALFGLLAAARPPRLAVWLLQTRPPARGKKAPARPSTNAAWAHCLRALAWSLGLWGLGRAGALGLPLQLPLLAGASFAALLLGVFLEDGRSRARGFSLLSGLWGAGVAALGLLPLLLGWGLAAMEGGSLALFDLPQSQANAPLGLGLLASPWALLSGCAYLLALVPRSGDALLGVPEVARTSPIVRALEEIGTGLALVLWVALYGGGLSHVSSPLLALGRSFFELLVLSSGLDWLRVLSGRASRRESWDLLVWPLVPVSLVAAAARFLVLRFDLTSAWEARLRWLPLLCLLSLGLWLSLAALRSLTHRGRRADPWL